MKSFVYIISACCLFLFSCKKDDQQAYSTDTGVRIGSYKSADADVQVTYNDHHLISTIVAKQWRQNTLPFPVPNVSFSTSTTNIEYVNNTPVKLATNIVMDDINLSSNVNLKWNGNGILLQTANENPAYQPMNWTADAQGRPTGFAAGNNGIKWTYDKNGDVTPENNTGGFTGTRTSTITYTNHKNPFNNGRIGLLLFMTASLQAPIDAVKFFSAHLPEKWEIITTRPITPVEGELLPPATTLTSKTAFNYSYHFDGSGLLTGITETILMEERRDALLVAQSETTNHYPVSSFRIR